MIARSQHEGVLTLRLAHGKASALDIELLDALASELDGAAEDVVSGRDRQGTEFTDGIFVLYGDPALEGRVEQAREPALAETLDVRETGDKGVVRMTYKVRVNFVGEGNKRTAEKYDGWRIFCYLLPYQVTDAKVEKTDLAKVVLPGETIIWDAGKGLKVGDERSVTFTARRVRD